MTDSEVIDDLLMREGHEYTDRPSDRGGPTKFGITLDTLRRWRKRTTTAEDVKGLTIEEAREIYGTAYVRPWSWVSDERLRVLLIDWGVNSKMITVIKGLQRAVMASPDGILGSQTTRLVIAAIEQDSTELYRRLWRARLDHYLTLALDEPRLVVLMRSGHPLQIANLRGWLHRLGEFACPG